MVRVAYRGFRGAARSGIDVVRLARGCSMLRGKCLSLLILVRGCGIRGGNIGGRCRDR